MVIATPPPLDQVTTIVTSSRKLLTIALSSLLFHHPLNGYHLAGGLAVFVGVLVNANAKLACSRVLVLPALAAVLALVLSQVMPPEGEPLGGTLWEWLPWLPALRAVASVRLLN